MASKIVKPCPVKDGSTNCGETETLAIIKEFKTLYESKMNKIDSAAGGDNLPVLQAKVRLQKQWIRDLTAQNELLVRAVEELEKEATEKVTILEQKLRSGGMQGTDVGLDSSDLPKDAQTLKIEAEMKDKDAQLGHMCKQLQDKTEEVKAVRRSLLDMRSALTIEVAEKHDVILSLRRDVQEFEEKCRQSNKQTQFKDDIIKELRKEMKSLKEEECEEQKAELLLKIKELQDRLNALNDELNFKDAKSTVLVDSGSYAPTMDTSTKNINTSGTKVINGSSITDWNDATSKFMKESSKTSFDATSKFTNGSSKGSTDATSKSANGSRKGSNDESSKFANGSNKSWNSATKKGNVDNLETESLYILDTNSDSTNSDSTKASSSLLDKIPSESLKTTLSPRSDPEKLKQAMMRSIDSILEISEDTSDTKSDKKMSTNLDSSGSTRKKSVVNKSKRAFSSIGNIPVSLVNKDDILSKYNSVNDIADIVEYIVDRTLSFAEKNELNFQMKVVGQEERPLEDDSTLDWDLSRVRPITSTPIRGNDRADNLDREIAELHRLAENDCQLFLNLGRELDRILRNSHEKDQQIENQKEMIRYLIQRLVIFHRKFHEMQRLQSRHKSEEVKADCVYIRKNNKSLEEENKELNDEIARLKALLEKLQGETKEISSQRDTFRRKSEDASKQINAMNEKNAKAKADTEKQKKADENEKTTLKQQNAAKSKELQETRRASNAMASDLNKVKTAVQEKSATADNLKSDLELERQERKKQSEQIASLSAENQRQHDLIQDLYDQIRKLQESSTAVYCHCDEDESDATETKHVSVNTSNFKEGAKAAQSNTSSTATGTWVTTDSDTKPGDEEDEMEEIHTLTVIKTMERKTISSSTEQRIAELEDQLTRAMREREIERAKHCQEMCNLKQTIMQLEGSGGNNRQTNTVELFKNSITLLEVAEERAKVEISQQRQTIINLQEALVASKHQIEELQQKSSNEVFLNLGCIAELKNALRTTDQHCSLFYSQINEMDQLVENLRDSNLELEVENFAFCQDIAILEARLLKYQHDFKVDEECSAFKNELLKLLEENKNQISANSYLQQQLISLTAELQEMQDMKAEAKELQLILQKANEEMENQANVAQGELDNQIKSGEGEIGAHALCDCSTDNTGGHPPSNLRNAQSDVPPCEIGKRRNQGRTNASSPITPTDYSRGARMSKKQSDSCECGIPPTTVAVCDTDVYSVAPSSSGVDGNMSQELLIQETNFYEVSLVRAENSDEEQAGGSCMASPFIICEPCTKAQYKDLEEESVVEMQQAIANKSNEVNQFEDLLYNTQEKLDLSLRHNEDLKDELLQLISQIQNYEQEKGVGEGGSLCKREIECCRDNLCDLKEKFYKMKDLLDNRNRQFCELQAKFQVQSNMCECLKQQLQGTRLHYENDICELKHNICDLNNKLIKNVTNYEMLQDDYRRSQALLVEVTMRETKLQKEQGEMADKLKMAQMEEKKLCCCVEELKEENTEIINSMNSKERQYDLATSQVDELKAAAKSQLNVAQQEIKTMKNEVQRLSQDRSSLKQQNEKLQRHICNLQTCTKKCEVETETVSEELKRCLCDIQVVKAERDFLENSCKKQRCELNMLHTAYANLNQDFQHVTELVINFENELSYSKANENEIRIDSQNVLSNVKTWLEEQKVLKDQLSQKIRSDEFEIFKLQHQVSQLEAYQCQCCCNCQMTPRQRGGANIKKLKHADSVIQCQKILRSLESHGSASPMCSENSLSPDVTSTFEDIDEQECMEDYASKVWLNKVENMTQELQKCNKYWKNKLLDKEYVVSKDNN